VNQTSKYQEFFDKESIHRDLKRTSVRGSAFSIGGAALGFVLRLGSTAILARLLIPEHFGLVSMVTALTAVAESFKDFGLSTATIQRRQITHEQVSTLFWVNALFGAFITAIACGCSLLIAWFYDDPRLVWITIALSTSFLWSGVTVQHQAILARRMQFATLALIDLGATTLSTVVAIALAMEGYGFWSLVWRDVSRSAFLALGTWYACPWVPTRPSRNNGTGSMLKMGGDVTAFNLIVFLTASIDLILIGKFFGATALGLYRQANQLAQLPASFLTHPLQSVAQPAMRVLLDDPARYRDYYRKVVSILALVSMPVMAFLFVFAHEIIVVLLGEKWVGSVVIFKIYAALGLIRPAMSTVGLVLITQGRTKQYLHLGIFNSLAVILGMAIGLAWGVEGIAYGHAFANCLILLPTLYFALRETPVSPRVFMKSALPSLLCSLWMIGLLTPMRSAVSGATHWHTLMMFVPVGIVLYAIPMLAVPAWRATLMELTADVSSMFNKNR